MKQHKRVGSSVLAAAIATTLILGGCGKPPEAPAKTSASSSSESNVLDVDVTYRVTTALLLSDALKGLNIEVVTLKGDVRLIGVVNSQAQINEALKIARATEGVHAIHDELTIKK